MKITERYLKVPVSRYVQRKSLIFSDENGIFMDYRVQLCPDRPEYFFYIDMRFALGRTLTFRTEPDLGYEPQFTDSIPDDPGLYDEKFRPAAHFTCARGWLNDPNGLIYYNGMYHMFYQHNPAGPMWSNMHWGHAVSPDLLHWEEKEIALFPDELGTAYSGSAVEDIYDLTGLKENENNVMLLYYTACNAGMKLSAGKKTTQCLAYSTDGGETFRKYSGNPVIGNIIADNRDPKVIYVPEEKCYFMALFLDCDRYALLRSDDLLDWKMQQTLRLEGDGECPDFYPIVTEKGKRYWVFTGAHDKYLLGKIEDGNFIPSGPVRSLNFGNKAYAAQTFSGLPCGRRVRISWNRSEVPESCFDSSMCTPVDMGITEEEDGALFLTAEPVSELESIEKECSAGHLKGKAHDIRIDLHLSPNAEVSFSLLGFGFTVSEREHCIKTGNYSIPLYDENGHAFIRLITDTTSVELYSSCGKAYGVFENAADYSLNFVTYDVRSGRADTDISAYMIENIWGK